MFWKLFKKKEKGAAGTEKESAPPAPVKAPCSMCGHVHKDDGSCPECGCK